ncbi:MAG: hypothetical protein LBG77_01125 [Dysgonamonadaceae bacterium]|jgi:hypothetical protein|nr:hypothetical protein [Dysgonamonadaceae bacterium]
MKQKKSNAPRVPSARQACKSIRRNFNYAIWSEAGLTDFQLFTLLQEGVAL